MKHIELSDIQGDKTIANIEISRLSSLSLSADALCGVLNDINDSFGSYLPLSGGEVEGVLNVTRICTNNLSCLQYVQTDKPTQVFNFAQRLGHVEAGMGKYKVDSYTKVGACVGVMGYCVLSAFNNADGNASLKLSGDLANLENALKVRPSETWTLAFGDYNIPNLTISQVSSTTDGATDMVVLNMSFSDAQLKSFPKTESEYVEMWDTAEDNEDDSSFYCPGIPDAGNQIVPHFYCQHIEGCKTRAIQRCTHAEGRRTLADGRYSHAEGSDSKAIGAQSHVEGNNNIALGAVSHVEGANNTATGPEAHAEGYGNVANGGYSHVGGSDCVTDGDDSFAHGLYCNAKGSVSFALGYKAMAPTMRSFVWNANETYSKKYGEDLTANGIFAINPIGAANGFYIGTQTLSAIINSAVEVALKAKGY